VKRAVCFLLLSTLWVGSLNLAQGPHKPHASPLDAELFPPQLVKQHRQEIGLTDEQSRSILEIVKEGQGGMLEARWELVPELEKLRQILAEPKVNADEAQAQLARVIEKENLLKELQLMLMIRVKNELTPEQQQKLRGLRPERMR